MEEEKRRKKNRKKKNKQSKAVVDGVVGSEESATRDQHLVNYGKDEHCQLSEDTDEQSTIVGSNRQPPNGKECAISEETIRNVKEENVMHIQKEAMLEESVNTLRTENDLLAKEQGTLKMRIAQLQGENDSLLQIKAGLDEKTNQLSNENSVLSLQVKSTKETVSCLNDDISRLQLQVAELEECRNILLLENQQLKENLSGFQTKIWNLEKSGSSFSLNATVKDYASENEDLKSQIEAAQMLVEKMFAENAELVEKVNELYAGQDRPSAAVELSGASRTDVLDGSAKPNTEAIAVPESDENTSMLVRELKSSGEARGEDNSDTVNAGHAGGVISSSSLASEDSGEIVQIPLDDNDARSLELQAAQNAEHDEVPLTDAPLIGAPFRLISFVAKYVSGADLVNQTSPNTSR